MDTSPKNAALSELKAANLACTQCPLRSTCRGVVFGEGNPDSPVMFVGEGPGQREDELGRPFVGRAGELLNKMLHAAEIPRESVYITNIVKCRPPENRTPTLQEMEGCLVWLREQYRIMKPRYMVLLGLASTHAILDKKMKMNQCRGQWFEKNDLLMMPTYHPAAILRNPNLKKFAWEDFQNIRHKIQQLSNHS